jgi:hypothetical protein
MSAKTLPGNTQTSHHHQQQQHYQQPTTRPLFLVLVDDIRGSNHQGGAYVSQNFARQHTNISPSSTTTALPAAYNKATLSGVSGR